MKVYGPIYDPGTSRLREDGAKVAHPFYVVVDGLSAPFSPKFPAKRFWSLNGLGGLSGGETAARLVELAFASAAAFAPGVGVEVVLKAANKAIRDFQVEVEIPVDDPGKLAGVTFAAVKIGTQAIRVVQGGDTFVLTAYRDGDVVMTRNQVHGHNRAMNALINDLKREIAAERGTTLEAAQHDSEAWNSIIAEMWNRFYEPLMQARRVDMNSLGVSDGYAILNGQPAVRKMWRSFDLRRRQVEAVLLFSDGLVPWEGMLKRYSPDEVAYLVYEEYQQAGRGEEALRRLVNVAREIERDTFVENYTAAEATAIALDFSDE